MSSQIRFFIVLVAALLLVGLVVLLWQLARRLRHLGDRRHDVRDPQGVVWATRLHWGRPRAGFGLGGRLFPRRRPESGIGAEAKPDSKPNPDSNGKRAGLPVWLEAPLSVLELFDAAFLVGILLAATVGLIAAVVIAIALALELFVVLLAAFGYAIARGLFGHPWQIEIDPPSGSPVFIEVRGFRAASDEHRRIRTLIELGRYELESTA